MKKPSADGIVGFSLRKIKPPDDFENLPMTLSDPFGKDESGQLDFNEFYKAVHMWKTEGKG